MDYDADTKIAWKALLLTIVVVVVVSYIGLTLANTHRKKLDRCKALPSVNNCIIVCVQNTGEYYKCENSCIELNCKE